MITDVVFSHSLKPVDEFCFVMGKIILPHHTIKLNSDMHLRGHRPERVWILEWPGMPGTLQITGFDKYQKARAELVAVTRGTANIIIVSDWR